MKKSSNSSIIEGDKVLSDEILEVISLFIKHLDNIDRKEVEVCEESSLEGGVSKWI